MDLTHSIELTLNVDLLVERKVQSIELSKHQLFSFMEIVMLLSEEELLMVMQNGKLVLEVLLHTLWLKVTKRHNFTQQHGVMAILTLLNQHTIQNKISHMLENSLKLF